MTCYSRLGRQYNVIFEPTWEKWTLTSIANAEIECGTQSS